MKKNTNGRLNKTSAKRVVKKKSRLNKRESAKSRIYFNRLMRFLNTFKI
jgi:hypothetical protein